MKHPLSKNVKILLNLEAAGTGGRNFIFQSTSSWLMRNIKNTSKSFKGTSIAQDMFETKLIPSDSDYRVFREHGIIGIDTAFFEHGHAYHTPKDSIYHSSNQSIYHMGETTEMLAKFMATYDGVYPNQPERHVYYDFLSSIVFIYSMEAAKFIHVPIILCGLIVSLIQGPTILLSLASLVISMIASIFTSLILSFIIGLIFNNPMSWYAYGTKFGILLYFLPSLFGAILSMIIFPIKNRSAVLLFWTIILLLGTFYQISSSYIPLYFTILFLFGVISDYLFYIFALVPLVFGIEVFFIITEVFFAVLGRSGTTLSEYIASGLVSFFTFSIFTVSIPLVSRLPKLSKVLLLKILFVLILITSCFSLTLFPYSEGSPKRLALQQVFTYNEGTLNGSYITLTPFDGISETIIPNTSKLSKKQVSRVFHVPTIGPRFKPEGYNVLNIPTNDTIKILPKIDIKKVGNRVSVDYSSEKMFALYLDIITPCNITNYSFENKLESETYNNETHHKFILIHGQQDVKGYNFWFEQGKCLETKIELNSILLESDFISNSLKKVKSLFPNWVSDYTVTVLQMNYQV